jgi:hypothetical protein
VNIVCGLCGEPVDPTSPYAWWGIHAVERKAQGASRRQGSDVALREQIPGEWYHGECVRRAQQGLAPLQESLL